MAATPSTMLPLGTAAPNFQLPDIGGNMVSLSDFKGAPALVVAFICNHCPYVKHIRTGLVNLARQYQKQNVAFVAINANDASRYPDDNPMKMAEEARSAGFPFPYLYDETQETAKAYRAACTPDFFLFDKNFNLVYRGQFDDSRPGNNTQVTGKDLQTAIDAILTGLPVPPDQKASIGCNIKWKTGNEPDYFQKP